MEAYTFNFQVEKTTFFRAKLTKIKYYKVAGTDTVVPIMSLGDKLSKMSLHRVDGDPIVDALKQGKLPTLGDVKRSLKVYIAYNCPSNSDTSYGSS